MSGSVRGWFARAGSVVDRGALRVMQRTMSRSSPRREPRDARELLVTLAEHYREGELYRRPEAGDIRATGRRPRRSSAVLDLHYPSVYRPTYRGYREEFAGYRANLTARARLFEGREGPAPVAICLHGWGGGAYFFEERAFPVHYLRRIGLDVVLFQLPFHGGRAPARAPAGSLFPSQHLVRTNEGFGQAISDLRALADWLRGRGATAVGVIGMSLGAYTAALWAGLDGDLDFCVAMIPAVDISELMWRHGSASAARRRAEKAGVTGELLAEVFRAHAPLSRPPRLSPERLMIIAGEGDLIAPPSQALSLWEHWRRPHIHWFPGGHLAQIGRGDAFRDLRRHLRGLGLAR